MARTGILVAHGSTSATIGGVAVFYGVGDTHATLVRISARPGVFVGVGTTFLSGVPEPSVGHGQLTAVMEIGSFPPILRPPPPTFTTGQTLGRELSFRATSAGNPTTPFLVTYAIFRILPGNLQIPHGDPQRRPAMASVGVFYPTLHADDLGPGDWMIRWTVRESFSSAPVVKDLLFRILSQGRTHGSRHGWF